LVLEEDAEQPSRRWIRLDGTCLRFGDANPPDLDRPRQLAAVVLEQAPYHLTLSDLDTDRLELIYGFDLDYSGNHDQLVAETLLPDHPLSAFLAGEHSTHIIECQPCIGIALTPECDLQAYVEVRGRSTTYEASKGQHEPRPLTINLSVRRYWGLGQDPDLLGAYDVLREHAGRLATDHVIPLIVNPLAHAIASRP